MKALKVMATIDEQGELTLYLPLITDKNSRVEVIVLIPEEADLDNKSQVEVLADFRQAWDEAMTGQTISVAQLWEGIEDV
ncbi:type II toxin-antitoxin system RelN family antitoxin [Microcoleus sp. F4-D5]|uniref:type II toxin-antitoxin system RelN family antitoxin n=1 Tax=Microcoleus sp. F4-D5 TaxID=2818760 RepID=UPI002FCEC9BD